MGPLMGHSKRTFGLPTGNVASGRETPATKQLQATMKTSESGASYATSTLGCGWPARDKHSLDSLVVPWLQRVLENLVPLSQVLVQSPLKQSACCSVRMVRRPCACYSR